MIYKNIKIHSIKYINLYLHNSKKYYKKKYTSHYKIILKNIFLFFIQINYYNNTNLSINKYK